MENVSSSTLYEKIEQVYRLLNAKVGSRCIGSGQGRYLQLLTEQDALSQSELVTLLGVSPSTASELTDKLLSAGHITRRKDDADKRKTLICITESGVAAVEAFRAQSACALDEAFDALSSDERAALLSTLCRMLDSEPDEPDQEAMIRPGKRL